MPISVIDGFLVTSAKPADLKTVVPSSASLTYITSSWRYDGMVVYSQAETSTWQLIGGVLDSNFVKIFTSGSVTSSSYALSASWAPSTGGSSTSSSWASSSISSSYALTASYATNAGSTLTTGSTYPITSSWSFQSLSSSYSLSSSWAPTGMSTTAISSSWASQSLSSSYVSSYPDITDSASYAVGIKQPKPRYTLDVSGSIGNSGQGHNCNIVLDDGLTGSMLLNVNKSVVINTFGNIGSATFGGYSTPLVINGSGSNTANVFINSSGSANPNSAFILCCGGGVNYTAWYAGSNNISKFRLAPMATVDETGYTNAKDGAIGITINRSGSVGIGNFAPTNSLDVVGNISCSAITASLVVGTNISSSGLYISNISSLIPVFVTSNINKEAEIVNTNTNLGISASADFVAVNGSGSYLVNNYVDLGINGPGHAIPSFIGGPNDAYLFSTASNFFIGNITPSQSLYLFAGGTNITNSVKIDSKGNLSGSNFVGTSSWAISASWSPAGVSTSAISASWSSQSFSSSYALTASSFSAISGSNLLYLQCSDSNTYAVTLTNYSNSVVLTVGQTPVVGTNNFLNIGNVNISSTASYVTSSNVIGTVTSSSYSITASYAPSSGLTVSTWNVLPWSASLTWSATPSTYEDRQILALSGSTTMSITNLYNGWAGVMKVTNTGSNLGIKLPTGTKVAYGGTGSINITNGISGSVTDFVAFSYDGTTLYANVANFWN